MFLACFALCFFYESHAQIYFVDKAINYDLIHTYVSSSAGGGISCVDFNNDGWDDLTLASGLDEPVRFFLNDQTGKFNEIEDLIDNSFKTKQVLWADYDNDGDKDLFVAAFDGVNKLYENEGDLNMIDVSESAGIPQHLNRTIGANFADFNRDGWLDLYICHRGVPGSGLVNENRLYKNNGDGTFRDVTLFTNTNDLGRAPFCSVFTDFNKDGWPDIYIANDRGTRNTLLVNQKNFFVDASELSGSDLRIDAMCTTIADLDKDGTQDIYVTNNVGGNRFLQNTTNPLSNLFPTFKEIADSLEITMNGNCWGSQFVDVENDGLLDLYVSGAIVGSDTVSSVFYKHTDPMTFKEHTQGFGKDTVKSYNNALGDFNNDGFTDLVVLNAHPYNMNYWENTGSDGNWIKIKLEGVISNRDGISSTIEVYAEDLYHQSYTTTAISFMGQNSDSYLFGLADHTRTDSVIVTWPTGHVDKFYDLESKMKYHLYEGQSTNDSIIIDNDVDILIPEVDTVVIIDATEEPIESFHTEYLVYPNPTIHSLYINPSWPNKSLLLYDSKGNKYDRLVEDGKIDVHNLQPGIYFLEIKLGSKSDLIKFIKADE